MSNRFHNKLHRQNHHSNPTSGYPDSALDPIASFEQPFQGEFYSQGDIITTQNLSAGINLTVGNDGLIQNNLTVKGNLNVFGTTTQLDTLVYATSALSVVNAGTGPAATFKQTGNEPVAVFYDDNNTALYIDGKAATPGYVGIGTNAPGAKLTVSGTLSSSSTVEFPNIGTGTDNSVVILNSSGFLKTDEINPAVWDTTAKYVSASDGALTVNRLTKATDSTGINESIVTDDGSLVSVAGNLSASGTATIGTIATGSTNSIVIESSGLIQKRTANPSIWDTTSKYISASDGALTVNRLTKAADSTGINESIVTDDGSLVSVAGNLSASGTATIGTIADNSTNTSVVVQTAGLLQKRTLNTAAFDTTSKFVSASDGNLDVGYIPVAENALGLDSSIIYQNGSNNVGIGTDAPGAKLTVSGTLSTSGTATIGTIATGTGTSVVIETGGLLQKCSLNAAAFDTASKYVSASDGTLTVNYLTKATDSNGINESIVYDDGTNVGIGETSPEGKLHVKSGSAGSVTAQPNSIGVFESSSNAYVSILSPNAQYAGVVMGGPNNPYGSYVSWNHDNSALKVATAHSQGNIQFLVNTEQEAVRILSGGNVGIGTTNPKEKLTVSGNLSASGTATIGTIATGSGTSVLIESSGLVQKRSLNAASFDTTSRFVSASDGALTVNYLTKATNSNGINESIISDNGSLVYVGGNLTISGNLTALGNSYFANTLFTTTSSISVVNNGPGPAMYVYQGPGTSDVASFYDGDGVEVLHIGNCDPGQQLGKIGINESDPIKELTVKGSVSASGTFNLGTINTNDSSNSFVVLGTDNILQKRAINIAATNTTSKFVSASDGALTVNRLTKATDSTGINESIVFDSGTNVGIGTDVPGAKLTVSGTISSSSTVEFPNIGTGTDNSVVILNSSGFLKTDEINPAVWDTTAKYISASDGSLTVNRLTKAADSTGINESIVTDDGSLVSVAGNLSTSGTATIGTLADSLTNTSVVVQTAGLLQKRSLNAAAFDTTSKFVSASDGNLDAGYIPVAENALGLDSSVIYQNGSSNIGIGTTNPEAKLTVSGTLSTSGTATIGTIADSLTNTSVVVQTAGLLQKRTLNTAAFDTTSKFVSASDGALTVNRLTKAENSNGIDESIVFDDGTNVGIGTDTPGAKLTVSGTLSTSGTATIGTLAAGTVNSVLIESSGLVQKRTIDSRAWGSSLVDGTGTTNYVAKWSDSDTVTNSIVFDNGTNVGIGTDTPGAKLTVSGTLSTSGTATIGTLADSLTNTSVVVQTAGLLQKRTLNTAAFDTTSKFVSASDGALTVNRLSKATNSNGINESIVYDDGTNVGIGTDTPGAKLSIQGTLSSSSTVNFGGIGTGTDNSVVVLDSSGFLRTDEIDSRVWGSSLVDGTGTTNYVAKWSDSDTVTNSIVFDNGTNVGIGTDTPGAKLTVSGTLSSSSAVNFGGIGTGTDNSVVVLDANGFLRTDEINPAVWDTTSKFVSASDGALTVNRLTKATDSNGINESIVTDNGALVSVGGNLSTTGTTTIGTIATGTAVSVLIESSGLVQKRTIDSRAWGSSLVDGTGTANRVTYWTDSNTIAADDDFFFNGTNVGIGTTSPSEKLTVSGNISASGLIIPGSATVTPTTTTALPEDNDVIFNNQTGVVTITGFSSGRAGVTYTLTNKSTHEVTLSSSSNLFVRGGSTWAGYKCSANPSGKIELPQNFSCSLRMDSATSGSVW